MKVVVAMSGGVDSSVTAALLVEQGHEVIGIHMKLHDRGGDEEGRCCGFDDAMDARLVADRLGIPFYVANLRDAFAASVMDALADGYLAGETPNPCVTCNGVLKFRVLLQRAMALGADRLATGHYARIVEDADGPALAVAADAAKDQTYFLYPMTRRALERTWFPLGGLTKPEVRAHAARLGLSVAEKPESQEICFVPDDDHAAFVRGHRPDAPAAGEIVSEDGAVLGRHDAYYRYTIGQRRGLGVAANAPLYVLGVDAETRRVTVGPDARLWTAGLVLRDPVWHRRPAPDEPVEIRLRHRGQRVPCVVDGAERPTVRFLAPARAVSPGQAAVLYRGDVVLGGGTIAAAVSP